MDGGGVGVRADWRLNKIMWVKLGQRALGDPLQHLLGEDPHQLPADVQRLIHSAVLIGPYSHTHTHTFQITANRQPGGEGKGGSVMIKWTEEARESLGMGTTSECGRAKHAAL